jgi:alkane 1-monooxygenase
MKMLYGLRYTVCLLPGILAVAGCLFDVRFHIANILWTLFFLVFIDWLLPPQRRNPPANQPDIIPNLILYIASALHISSIALLVYVANSGTLEILVLSVISVGLNAGISGIVVAHELIHRKNLAERLLGQLNMFVVNYTHFYIEHVRGHHKRVGTPEDPATARFGENLYAFVGRTVPGQWRSALMLEAERIRKSGGNSVFGFNNFVVRALLLQIICCAAIGYFLGWVALAVYLGQSVVAIFQLEYVNYIEHYGLVRKAGSKVEVQHSWQSDAPSSRLTLIELSRHADHHLKASKPYHALVSHDGGPELNSGYFGMFYAALIPPIWFRLIHRRMAVAGVLPVQSGQ